MAETPADEFPETATPPQAGELELLSESRPHIDLTFLQDPSIYHQIPSQDVPNPFLESEKRPIGGATLSELVQRGHFRLAAENSLDQLLACRDQDAELLLQMLYTRLACLILISRPDIAAQEAVPLINVLAQNIAVAQDIALIVPWELRLLLVRLQTIGAVDGGRRGVMQLYALAQEVRSNLRRARESDDASEARVWSARLEDLGLRVCDALVEMGELETAMRHLDTISNNASDELVYRKALLRVRVGDVSGARRYADDIRNEALKKSLGALLQVANGNYTTALQGWTNLMGQHPNDELFASNAAISLLYTGRITSAREALEDIATRLPLFTTLLFNLSTVYELCTEKALDKKASLARQAASKEPAPESGGWERLNFELKV